MDFIGNDPTEVRSWTGSFLENPQSLVTLAQTMTGESWSIGMGGFGSMGDRVAKHSITVQIRDDTEIIDAPAFQSALEAAQNNNSITHKEKTTIRIFLQAWNSKNRGADD